MRFKATTFWSGIGCQVQSLRQLYPLRRRPRFQGAEADRSRGRLCSDAFRVRFGLANRITLTYRYVFLARIRSRAAGRRQSMYYVSYHVTSMWGYNSQVESYFVNAPALWFLALSGVILALYLLRLKRRRMTVSSTLLFEKAVEEFQANAPLQWLKKNLLLLLQLIVLALLVLALSRPFVSAYGAQ